LFISSTPRVTIRLTRLRCSAALLAHDALSGQFLV
jgi:hypothetical protein